MHLGQCFLIRPATDRTRPRHRLGVSSALNEWTNSFIRRPVVMISQPIRPRHHLRRRYLLEQTRGHVVRRARRGESELVAEVGLAHTFVLSNVPTAR